MTNRAKPSRETLDRKNAAARAKREAKAQPAFNPVVTDKILKPKAKPVQAVEVVKKAKPVPKPKVVAVPAPVVKAAPVGRPMLGDAPLPMSPLTFKATPQHHKTWREMPGGGATWVRKGLDDYHAAKLRGEVK